MTRMTEGIRAEDQSIFAQVAVQMHVWILVRGTNKESLRFIGKNNYLPKPVECKAKTAHQGGAKAGLVVCPHLDRNAFSDGKKTEKAISEWANFAGKNWAAASPSQGLPAGYDIDMTKGPYFGCVRKDGHYLHGDYDLYDVVDPDDPAGETRVEKLVNGIAVSYSARSLAAQKALNAKFVSNMVQHGDHLSWNDHTDDLIVAYGPENERVYIYPFNSKIPLNAIRGVYATIFPGRGSRRDQPPSLRQVK